MKNNGLSAFELYFELFKFIFLTEDGGRGGGHSTVSDTGLRLTAVNYHVLKKPIPGMLCYMDPRLTTDS